MLFKIITGIQSGSSVSLELNKTYSVGNSLEFDIFIDAVATEAPLLLEFRVVTNEISFSAVADNILLADGQQLVPDVNYPLPLILKLNNVTIGIGEAAALEQYDLDFITNVAEEDEQDVITDPELENILDSAAFDDSHTLVKNEKIKQWWLSHLLKLLWSIKEYLTRLSNELKRKSKVGFYTGIVVIILISLMLLIIPILVAANNKIEASKTKFIDEKHNIMQVVMNLPKKYSNLTLQQINSKFYLQGTVASESDLKQVKSYFKNRHYLQWDIVVYDNIVPQLRQILDQNELATLSISYIQGIGLRICVTGIISDISKLGDAQIELDKKFPELGEIDTTKVFSNDELNEDLNKLVKDNAKTGVLNITPMLSTRTIQIKGYISLGNKQAIIAQIKILQDKYLKVLTISYDLEDVLAILPYHIVQIHEGNPSYLLTQDNRIIFEGGEIKGVTLLKITATQLYFKSKVNFMVNTNELLIKDGGFNDTPPQLNQESLQVPDLK